MNILNKNHRVDWDSLEQYDWIQAMKSCMQDEVFHAEGDVYTHTQMVMDELLKLDEFENLTLQEQIVLQYAVVFHDIAKPKCTIIEDGRIRSPKHAKLGEKMTRELLWNMEFEQRELICSLVRLHGLPIWVLEKSNPNAEVIRSSLRVSNHLLYLLAKADVLGRIAENIEEFEVNVEFFKELCIENKCFATTIHFENSVSRFKFFENNEIYPPIIFDNLTFEMILMSGIPGSGKDTYCNQLDYPIISLDRLRLEHKVMRGDKKGQGQLVQIAYEMAKEYGRKKQSFIWNSTNLTRDMRQKIINLVLPYHPKIKIVYIETSWENLFKRRATKIRNNSMLKMIRLLEIPQLDEAHEVIYLRS